MLKIFMKQNTNKIKSILMILKLLLNTQMIWMIVRKTWKNKTQLKTQNIDCI